MAVTLSLRTGEKRRPREAARIPPPTARPPFSAPGGMEDEGPEAFDPRFERALLEELEAMECGVDYPEGPLSPDGCRW